MIVLLIGSLPFWILSVNKFSHRYFSCKNTFNKTNLSEGVWKKIPHLSLAVCLHQDCRNLVLLETSIFLSNSIEIHQQAEKSVARTLQCTQQSCTELISRCNQDNNTNLVSSFPTQIANLTALKSEAPFSLVAMYYSKFSSQNCGYNATDNLCNSNFQKEKD